MVTRAEWMHGVSAGVLSIQVVASALVLVAESSASISGAGIQKEYR